ncbi:MAG: septal ring lytic transglycosylase RlpA family protein [Hyphomicrobiaceae bacterium]|nr:septal ring lytic transglycosylase RlpA family protein [Hyphomicrobiaceae bacterium]
MLQLKGAVRSVLAVLSVWGLVACAPVAPEHAAMHASSWATDVAAGLDRADGPHAGLAVGSVTAAGQPPYRPLDPLRKGGGYLKVGKPYEIAGVRYHPKHDPDYVEIGQASWYGDAFHAKRTANGEIYNMDALTAAHRTLPLPSLVKVTNLRNGRSLLLRVNDRGPFKKGRIIDVSRRAADVLGFKHMGTAEVRVEYVGPAPLDGDDSRERAVLAKIGG